MQVQEGSVLRNNLAKRGCGGAIGLNGTAALIDIRGSSFIGNRGGHGGYTVNGGGAVCVNGTAGNVSVASSVLSGNGAGAMGLFRGIPTAP